MRFFPTLMRFKWLTMLASILLAVGAASGARFLYFNDDYRIFFSPDFPPMLEYDKVQDIYNRVDNVFISIKPKSGVFNKEFLASIEELTEDLWQIPYSNRVDSLTNYQHTDVEEDDLIVGNLVENAFDLNQEDIEKIKRVAANEPSLVGRIISPNGTVTAINITINIPAEDSAIGVPIVAGAVKERMAEYQAEHSDTEVHLSGIIMLNNAFAESAVSDLKTLMPLLVLSVLLIMGLLVGTISGSFATFIVVILSVITGYGTAGWLGIYLSGPAMIGLYMILTLAVADCVHILSSFYYEMRHGAANKTVAMLESLKINFMPVFITSLTTAIGFLTLNFSDVGPFRDLGNIVAAGVIGAFIFSTILLPMLMLVLPVRVKQRSVNAKSDMMEILAEFVIRNSRKLLFGASIVSLIFIALMPLNILNDEFTKYFDTSTSIRQATEFSDREIGGNGVFELSLDTKVANGINNPNFLKEADTLTQWLKTQPEVRNVNSLSDIIKRLNKTMNQDNSDFYNIPKIQELAAQYLLLYELSLPYGLDLNNQINVDKSATRIVITITSLDSEANIAFEKRIQDWLNSNVTTFEAKPVGTTLMFSYIGQININSSLISAFSALMLISLVLLVALRSWRYGLISFIPNLLPAGIAFGIWYLIKGQIGIANSIVVSLALGIIVDDTVHFLSKYLHAKRHRGANTEDAIRYAFRSVGRALWITTVALVCGFIIMSQSTYLPNAEMAVLTCITIITALLIDFLLLPPLLIFINRNERKKTT